uniref:Uncharacterized protein n=1 Tax=Setaria viridis TaxID=4556 RepID=A0A4U6WI23_SETVI|nr:hypothetical protein SEVIR_1G061700v2 [Setaria viridis]
MHSPSKERERLICSFRLQVSEVRLNKRLQLAVSDKVIPSADEGAVSLPQYHLKSPLEISGKRRTDLSGPGCTNMPT